jgi:RNA polymerase sigma factor (TIGR02999 family)
MDSTAGSEDVTLLLRNWSKGDRDSLDRLTPLVYRELRGLATAKLRGERPDHTLQPTALLHEAYLRLVRSGQEEWHGRAHFYAVASVLMREILVDHARKHRAEKRGSGAAGVSFDEALSFAPERGAALLALDDALGELKTFDERKSRLIQLKYFGGLTGDEIAEVMGISRSTVTREVRLAEAWLHSYVQGKTPGR